VADSGSCCRPDRRSKNVRSKLVTEVEIVSQMNCRNCSYSLLEESPITGTLRNSRLHLQPESFTWPFGRVNQIRDDDWPEIRLKLRKLRLSHPTQRAGNCSTFTVTWSNRPPASAGFIKRPSCGGTRRGWAIKTGT
jgi:hypothetical protein